MTSPILHRLDGCVKDLDQIHQKPKITSDDKDAVCGIHQRMRELLAAFERFYLPPKPQAKAKAKGAA